MNYSVDEIKKQILNNAGDFFTNDSGNLININLIQYREQLNTVLKGLLNWNRYTNKANKEALLKNAYITIMQFRTYLLGSNNQIFYRLYIRNEKLNTVSIVNLSEQQLMEFVTRDRTSLRLKQNLNAAINDTTQDSYRQAIFNKHHDNIMQGFETATNSTMKVYVVTKEVINKYDGETSEKVKNLVFQKAYSKKGPYPYTRRIFNRGWIYQAFDETIENLGNDNNQLMDESIFHQYYFTEALKYDNVVGFKGGDVGLAQIKANMASIMNKNTLIKYLKIINNILNLKIQENQSGTSSKEELKQYIISNFTQLNGTAIDASINDSIDSAIDKIVQYLTN